MPVGQKSGSFDITSALMSASCSTDDGVLISMWYGSIDSIPSGWAICDGTNGTPDLRGLFPRGASADTDITGETVGHTTALPSGTDFTTASKTVTPTGTVSVESHRHSIPADYGGDITSASSGDKCLYNSDGSTASVDYTNYSTPSASFSGDSLSVGGQTVSSGGDDETAPDHMMVYFIAYIGE